MSEDKILERVRLLLARADHPNTPAPEAELCQKQADKLMFKHAIDEAMLRSRQSESERKTPEQRIIRLGSDSVGEFWPELRSVLGEVAYANRCRAVVGYSSTQDITLVGFAEDVAWTEMLFTSIFMSFVRQINPKWDRNTSYDHNVYNFKVAGYKWKDINKIARENGGPDHERYEPDFFGDMKATGKIGGAMIAAYKRHAKAIGDTNMVSTQSHTEYRRQFTTAFCNAINIRLRNLRDEQEKDADSIPGAALALVDTRKVVNEEFFRLFPQFRPPSKEEMETRRIQEEIERERARKEREDMLNAMTPSQRYEFLEKEQRKARLAAQRDRRYWEKERRSHDSSAHARGRSAAANVDLNKPGAPVKKAQTRKELS